MASDNRRLLVPLVSLAYAGTIAAALLAIDQLAQLMPGPWFDVLAVAVLLLSLMTLALLLRAARRRHRERLDRRALLWVAGALGPALLAALAVFSLVESAQNASVISGADVHLTRPMIDALPRPPGTRLLDERPGIADTETIYQDFTAQDVKSIVPYYESQLAKRGWAEDTASSTTSIVRFTQGAYVLAVEITPPSGGYTLTLDHVNPNLLQSPSPSPT